MKKPTTPLQEKFKRSILFFGSLAACLVLAVVIIVLGVKDRHLNAQLADAQKQLAQTKSQATQAQADLAKATTASTQLQSQLAKAKGQQTDLQSQMALGKDALTQVQSQLDKAKAQSADLQVQQDSAKAQSAGLQTQLNQATSGSDQLLTQLDQAKILSLDLESRLQTAERDITELQPLLLKARHMPVTTSFEKLHGSGSFTLHINNLYLQPVNVDITTNGTDKTRSQSSIIGGGATLNVDKLAAGESIVIASAGFDPVNLTVQ
jgi:uncharacterized phage infection (PIP) family protein YhgE